MATWFPLLRAAALLLPLALSLPGCTAELKEQNNAQLGTIATQEQELARLTAELERLKLEVADAKAERARRELAERLGMKPGEQIWARLQTGRGEILCELLPLSAPQTVANFVALAEGSKPWSDPATGRVRSGVPFYDGTVFHRVIPEFMIQGGDRLGTGKGNAGFTIPDEIDPELRHTPGTLSMANTGVPNSGSTQFFITEAAAPQLDGKHSAFGQCEPLIVIRDISQGERDASDRPLDPVPLRSVTIHRGSRPR